jgi:hypothetical protein
MLNQPFASTKIEANLKIAAASVKNSAAANAFTSAMGMISQCAQLDYLAII